MTDGNNPTAEDVRTPLPAPTSDDATRVEAGQTAFVYVNLPAHRAAYTGDVDSFPSIFEKEGVPMLDVNGNTPLHVAAKTGKGDCIRWLLTHTCIPKRAKNKQEDTAVHVAAASGNLKCLQMLLTTEENALDAACDRNADRLTTLHLAAINGHVVICMWLLMEYKGTIAGMRTKSGMAVLHIAAEKGLMEIVKLLTKLGPKLIASRDNKGQTPLHYAAKSGNLQCLKYMVEHGQLNPRSLRSFTRATPLHAAAVGGHIETLKWVLAKMGALMILDKMDGGITPLHIVAGRGHVDCLKWMVNQHTARKVNIIDVRDNQGRTPAYYAAEMGKVQCLSFLVDEGADVHSTDKNGNTPYTLAIQGSNKECNMYALSLTGGKVIDPKFVTVTKATSEGEEAGARTPNAARPVVSQIISLKAIDEDIMRNFKAYERETKHRGKKKSRFPKSKSLSREQRRKIKVDEKKSASLGQTGGKSKNSPEDGAKGTTATETTPTPLRQLFQSPTNRTIALPEVDDEQQLRSRQHFLSDAVKMDNYTPPKYDQGPSTTENSFDEHGENWMLKKKEFAQTTPDGSEANSIDNETLGDSFNWVDESMGIERTGQVTSAKKLDTRVPVSQNSGGSTGDAQAQTDRAVAGTDTVMNGGAQSFEPLMVVTSPPIESRNVDFSPPSSPDGEGSEQKMISIEAMVHRQNSETVEKSDMSSHRGITEVDRSAPSPREAEAWEDPLTAGTESVARSKSDDPTTGHYRTNMVIRIKTTDGDHPPTSTRGVEAENHAESHQPAPVANVKFINSPENLPTPISGDVRVENQMESLPPSLTRDVRIVHLVENPTASTSRGYFVETRSESQQTTHHDVRNESHVRKEQQPKSRDTRIAENRPPPSSREFRIEKSAEFRPPSSTTSAKSEQLHQERRKGNVNDRILQLMANFERDYYAVDDDTVEDDTQFRSRRSRHDVADVSRTWLTGTNDVVPLEMPRRSLGDAVQEQLSDEDEEYYRHDEWPKHLKKTKKQVRFLTPSKGQMQKSKPPAILPNAPGGRESTVEFDSANGSVPFIPPPPAPPPPPPPPPSFYRFENVETVQTDSGINSPRESPSSSNGLVNRYSVHTTAGEGERHYVSYDQEKYNAMSEALKNRLKQRMEAYPELQ